MKENFAKALVDAPGHLFGYVVGLVIALLGDFTLITLAIFAVLLALATGSALIAATAFFGFYFLMRLVAHLAEGIRYHAGASAQGAQQQAQATMQIAGVLAQQQEQPAPDA